MRSLPRATDRIAWIEFKEPPEERDEVEVLPARLGLTAWVRGVIERALREDVEVAEGDRREQSGRSGRRSATRAGG